jgi:hypothetical protein
MGLPIGINENIVLSKATKNDKGTLVVGFKEVKEINVLEAMNSAGASLEASEQDFLLFAPTIKNFDGSLTSGEKMFKTKVKDYKDYLEHILLQYYTQDKIKWDMFAGIEGLNGSNVYAKFEDEAVITKVCNNLVNDFIKLATPVLNNTAKKKRLKVIRKANSRYVALPKFAPFFEDMSIPKEQSKLKFSNYEIANKLNEPLTAEATSVSSAEAEEARSLFA